jgi:hypothetical protein
MICEKMFYTPSGSTMPNPQKNGSMENPQALKDEPATCNHDSKNAP